MIGDHTYRWTRTSLGSLRLKQVYHHSFGYTATRKEVSAASNTAVLAATAATVGTDQDVTSGITNPDVPRALKVVPGGTTADIQDSDVIIYGTNVEGASISEEFHFAAGASSAVEGNKAFKTVTRVNIDAQLSTAATFSVGTTNKLGVNHRLWANNTTVKVFSYTDPGEPGGMPDGLTAQAAPTVVASDTISRNLVTPATAPDGTTSLEIFYTFDNWNPTPLNDEPEWSTSTSTSSTSSSTSTTTVTTSTSSTSTSTSVSSTSTSSTSTSISTSSTSTSTTTVP